ncbi:hypothetical protein BJY00DRAFT_294680 [Aspergillus carlsbadensis]|nr:hypothetical protein BJY00DRAFT_294680 [Aspergillus carlsbadensis]
MCFADNEENYIQRAYVDKTNVGDDGVCCDYAALSEAVDRGWLKMDHTSTASCKSCSRRYPRMTAVCKTCISDAVTGQWRNSADPENIMVKWGIESCEISGPDLNLQITGSCNCGHCRFSGEKQRLVRTSSSEH